MRHLLFIYMLSIAPLAAQTTWTQRTVPKPAGGQIAGRAGLYLVSTQDGKYLRSTDGLVWTEVTTLPPATLLHCDGSRIAGFDLQKFWVTTDGQTPLSNQVMNPGGIPKSAANSGTTWVIAANDGSIFASRDRGVSWQPQISPAGQLTSVAWGGDKFIASTDDAKLLSSPDGLNWQIVTATNPLTSTVSPLAYYNGRFYWQGYSSASGTSVWTPLAGGPKDEMRAGSNALLAFDLHGVRTYTLSGTFQWTAAAALVLSDRIANVNFCGDLWIATTDSGKLFTSQPGNLPAPVAPALVISPAAELSWQSQQGRWYQVQRSPNNTTWADTGAPLFGDGGTMKWTAPASIGREFFRLQVR